jgi:hypothetical protein
MNETGNMNETAEHKIVMPAVLAIQIVYFGIN